MNVLLTRAIICPSSALGAVSWAQAQQTRTIYLVRHADKVSDGTDAPLSEAARFLNQSTGVNHQTLANYFRAWFPSAGA